MAAAETDLNIKERKVFLDSASLFLVDDNFSFDNFDLQAVATKCIGLTQGGADFKAKPEIKNLKFDGANGKNIKGTRRITKWAATLEVNVLELVESVFTLSLLEKKADEKGTATIYKPVEGLIDSLNYKNILVAGTTTDNKNIAIFLRDCINSEGFNLKTEDEKEGICKLKLEANYTMDKNFNITKEPFEIRILN